MAAGPVTAVRESLIYNDQGYPLRSVSGLDLVIGTVAIARWMTRLAWGRAEHDQIRSTLLVVGAPGHEREIHERAADRKYRVEDRPLHFGKDGTITRSVEEAY